MAAEAFVRHAVTDLRRAVTELKRQITDIQSGAANQERQLRSDAIEAERNATARRVESELVKHEDTAQGDQIQAAALEKLADEKREQEQQISSEAAEQVRGKEELVTELERLASELESRSGDQNLR